MGPGQKHRWPKSMENKRAGQYLPPERLSLAADLPPGSMSAQIGGAVRPTRCAQQRTPALEFAVKAKQEAAWKSNHLPRATRTASRVFEKPTLRARQAAGVAELGICGRPKAPFAALQPAGIIFDPAVRQSFPVRRRLSERCSTRPRLGHRGRGCRRWSGPPRLGRWSPDVAAEPGRWSRCAAK